MTKDPNKIYFTDICYAKTTQEYVNECLARINSFIEAICVCSKCGGPVSIEDTFLFEEEKLCSKCGAKRNNDEY